MIKKITGETWAQLQFAGSKQLTKKYAVSNAGRLASYSKNITEDGKLLTGSSTSGYKTLNLHINGKNTTIYIHREVARLFCKRSSSKQQVVVHANHKKGDNSYKNLKWTTQAEASAHQQKSPKKIAYKKIQANRTEGQKLNAVQVKAIKQIIQNPKRKITYQKLAEKYKVSQMTLFRIKSGECWGKVK
jgi:hypothetical protein